MKHTVVLGVTSGIAAYKTLTLIEALRKEDIDVFVVMTKNATKMIAPELFEKASKHKVFFELFEKYFDYKKILEAREVKHIALADKADVMIIAPATANIIAKLSHGISDDFLTTTALAVTAPIILCPSMNVNMWHNPLVQKNVNKLRAFGYIIINPEKGMLACGYEGVGRLAEIQIIKQETLHLLNIVSSMKGKKVIVTAGGTIEKIDDVRFIANRSSGKMGISIAEACYERGADVLLLRAKNTSMPRYHINEKVFMTAQDLLALIKENIKSYDYFYHNAAVSDFTVKDKLKGKLSSDDPFTLELEPQIKIIDSIKKINPKIKLIAFKAEHESDTNKLKLSALKKLKEANADVVVANDISKKDRGFESNDNEMLIVLPNGHTKLLLLASKKEIAGQLVDYIQQIKL